MSTASTESQTGSTIAQTPSWLTPYYQQGSSQLEQAQNNLPNLTNLYNSTPILGVPNLNTGQNTAVAQAEGAPTAVNQPLSSSNSALESFLGTPSTPSSATNAELSLFNSQIQPEIMQNAVLQGQGNSGAADAAVAQGMQSALVPFEQQDLSNTLSAAGTLGSQGLNTGQLQQTQIMNALTAAGVPYEVAAQQAQSLYEQQQQQYNFAQGIQTGAQSQFPNLIGGISNSVETSTPSTLSVLFDELGLGSLTGALGSGIGQDLANWLSSIF